MKQIYNRDLRVAEELWERDNRTCSPRGLPVAPSQWQEGRRRRATLKKSGWYRSPNLGGKNFQKLYFLYARVVLESVWSYLCRDRSETTWTELFISYQSLHETERGATMSRRTRRWILRVLLCLGIVYLKIGWAALLWLCKNLDSPTDERQLRAYLESNQAGVCINNTRVVHGE